jgi:hypothetical protein
MKISLRVGLARGWQSFKTADARTYSHPAYAKNCFCCDFHCERPVGRGGRGATQ